MERRSARPRLVVSRCLEFDPCRYDGSLIPSAVVAALLPAEATGRGRDLWRGRGRAGDPEGE